MSATVTRAPAASRWRTTSPPTCPAPCTATRTPAKPSPIPASSIAARMPQTTPHAVIGEGSPEPPFSTGRPVMWRVSRATISASAVDVPTSSAAR